jgi:hypothetical protein
MKPTTKRPGAEVARQGTEKCAKRNKWWLAEKHFTGPREYLIDKD